MTTSSNLTPAAQALQKHLALIGSDLDAWLELFSDDAVIEFPYAERLGLASALRGKPAIEEHMRSVLKAMTKLVFSRIVIYPIAGASQAIAEFHADALIGAEKVPYAQDYIVFAE